jgi:hypothetical protein
MRATIFTGSVFTVLPNQIKVIILNDVKTADSPTTMIGKPGHCQEFQSDNALDYVASTEDNCWLASFGNHSAFRLVDNLCCTKVTVRFYSVFALVEIVYIPRSL